jgi:hypothetical protein
MGTDMVGYNWINIGLFKYTKWIVEKIDLKKEIDRLFT